MCPFPEDRRAAEASVRAPLLLLEPSWKGHMTPPRQLQGAPIGMVRPLLQIPFGDAESHQLPMDEMAPAL